MAERSPNYPGMGLGAALQAIRQVYDKERRSTVTLELVAKALGHQSLSGPATSKVAALRQYGFLESAGNGKYRVSDAALTLLLKKPGDPEYDDALRRAALTPPLFAELQEAYPDASEDTLRYHLVKEKKFSEEGAARVIKAFRDAVSVANLGSESYTRGEEGGTSSGKGEERTKYRTPPSPPGNRNPPPPEDGKMSLDWILGGVKARLTFDSAPTAHTIDRLMAYLTLLKDDLPPPDEFEEPRLRDLEAEPA